MHNDCGCNPYIPAVRIGLRRNCRYYGFSNFVGDAFMTCVTGGLWLIWIFIREMRN